MSKLYGSFSQQKGSFGSSTVVQLNRQSVLKEKPANVKNPRTFSQMQRRVRIANLTNLWNAFTGNDRPSFESKPRTWSDNNAFVSANLSTSPVALTKQEAQQAACVVAAYQVTRGSLPSIAVEIASGIGKTDISLGSLVFDEETTLGDFSAAVVENNRAFRYGDQISCFLAEQTVNSVTGIPYVEMHCFEITLSSSQEELLADIVSSDAFSEVDGKLGTGAAVNGAVAYIHSRKTAKGTAVSTQRFVVASSILATYSSEAHLQEAVLSYGGNLTDYFLTPNIDTPLAPASGD